jgi:hypothetical protein
VFDVHMKLTRLQHVRCYERTKFEPINYYFKSKILQNNRGTLAIPTLYKLVVSVIMLMFFIIIFIVFGNFFARQITFVPNESVS